MIAGEFVARACCWDPVSPLELRRKALKKESAWRSYSTTRFFHGLKETNLPSRRQNTYAPSAGFSQVGPGVCTAPQDSDPCDKYRDASVLHTIDIADAPFDSTMSVELLPSSLTGRWQSIGLQFASERYINDMRFMEELAKSLGLIRLVRPLHGTVAGMCRSLHVLLTSRGDYDVSYSDPSLPFSIFVSCPPLTEGDRFQRLAENIIHEALHLQLSLVERVEPLVIHGAEHERVFSPWKKGKRTIRGLLHAVYVFNNLRFFWERGASNSANSSSFAENRIETIKEEMSSVRHLVDSPLLTAAGRRLASGSNNY